MIIKNVKVFTEDKTFIDGQIAIQDGVFAAYQAGPFSSCNHLHASPYLL